MIPQTSVQRPYPMSDLPPSPSDPTSESQQSPVDPQLDPEETNGQTDQTLEFDLGQSLQDSWTQIEVMVRDIPAQSQRAWQQTWAVLQLRWGGQAQELQQKLSSALAATRITGELDHLQMEVLAVARQLTPAQMEVLIEALPLAADRALVASLYTQVLDLDPQLDLKHPPSATRAYGLSGLPIVIGADDQVQVEASAALISAIVSIQIAGATAATALSFIGTPELRRLLKADDQLRSKALAQGRKLLPEEENWQLLRLLLNRTAPEGADQVWDAPLALTQLGIEGAQLAEFIGQQIKSILNIGLLRAFTPPILMEALQLLTSDLLFAVGISVEAALESTGAARRVELVLEALPKAQRIPSPQQIWEYSPQVLTAAEQRLRPLLTQQIKAAANGLDPQMRNATLNQIGQQLNLWNPFQFMGGWQGREWLSSVAQRLQELEVSYPNLTCLQIYASGLEEALQASRVMEQARILRSIAQQIDAESAEEI